MFLTRFNRPLDDAIATAQDTLPGLDRVEKGTPEDDTTCDNGACWT